MNLFVVTILAMTLHRPAPLVGKVYASYDHDPLLAVAIVEGESWFNPRAKNIVRDKRGKRIGSAWGLWQLVDLWHPQYRDDIDAHIREGATFLRSSMIRARGDIPRGLLLYNGGETGYVPYVMAIYRRVQSAVLLDQRYEGRLP